MERLRMVSSGTEATMSALRLARGYTGRERIIKFEGCYHGHADSLLVKAGSGALTLGEPDSGGVPKALATLTLTLPFNDEETLRTLFEAEGDTIAAVIVRRIARLRLAACSYLQGGSRVEVKMSAVDVTS